MKPGKIELLAEVVESMRAGDKPGDWECLDHQPKPWSPALWSTVAYYAIQHEARRKPKLRTVTVDGKEHSFPEPMREAPESGITYFYVDLSSDPTSNIADSYKWVGDGFDIKMLGLGLCHLSNEAAEQHARALIAISGGEVSE